MHWSLTKCTTYVGASDSNNVPYLCSHCHQNDLSENIMIVCCTTTCQSMFQHHHAGAIGNISSNHQQSVAAAEAALHHLYMSLPCVGVYFPSTRANANGTMNRNDARGKKLMIYLDLDLFPLSLFQFPCVYISHGEIYSHCILLCKT